jgi:hypothetical protein
VGFFEEFLKSIFSGDGHNALIPATLSHCELEEKGNRADF